MANVKVDIPNTGFWCNIFSDDALFLHGLARGVRQLPKYVLYFVHIQNGQVQSICLGENVEIFQYHNT